MSASRHFHTRAARYVFSPDEQSLMRFAGMETRGIAARATIRNLSETGLAFALGETEPPEEGSMLKVEFTLPGRKQIACFATVVRVEHIRDWDPDWGDRGYTLVALAFRNLPTMHVRALRLSLNDRIQNAEPGDLATPFEWQLERRTHAIALASMSVALVFMFYLMILPANQWLSTLWRIL